MSFPNMPTNMVTPVAGVASGLISALSAGTPHIQLYTDFMTASKKATKDKTGIMGMTDMFKSVGKVPFGILGVLMSFMEALNVVEPILDLITMIIEILSAAITKKMMPSFMNLFNAIMESGLIDLIILIGEAIGGVLGVVFEALIITLDALNPVIEILSDILGSDGMQDVILVLGKILGTVIMVGFIPLIYIIYALGTAIAAVMDVIAEIVTLGVHEDWAYSKAWQEGLGGALLEATVGIVEGIGELWAMEFGEEEEGGAAVTTKPITTEDVYAGKIDEGEITIIYIEATDYIDADDLAAQLDYRKKLGR